MDRPNYLRHQIHGLHGRHGSFQNCSFTTTVKKCFKITFLVFSFLLFHFFYSVFFSFLLKKFSFCPLGILVNCKSLWIRNSKKLSKIVPVGHKAFLRHTPNPVWEGRDSLFFGQFFAITAWKYKDPEESWGASSTFPPFTPFKSLQWQNKKKEVSNAGICS